MKCNLAICTTPGNIRPMQPPPDLSRLSDHGRKSYAEGLKILAAKRKTFSPSAQEMSAKSLREGQAEVGRKLATAAKSRTLTTATSTPSAPALISAEQFKNVCRAATTAATEAAKSYARSAKPAEKMNHFLTRHRIFCPGGFTGAKLNGRILG